MNGNQVIYRDAQTATREIIQIAVHDLRGLVFSLCPERDVRSPRWHAIILASLEKVDLLGDLHFVVVDAVFFTRLNQCALKAHFNAINPAGQQDFIVFQELVVALAWIHLVDDDKSIFVINTKKSGIVEIVVFGK